MPPTDALAATPSIHRVAASTPGDPERTRTLVLAAENIRLLALVKRLRADLDALTARP